MSQVEIPISSSIVVIHPDDAAAERAARRLHDEGIAMSNLSIIGRPILPRPPSVFEVVWKARTRAFVPAYRWVCRHDCATHPIRLISSGTSSSDVEDLTVDVHLPKIF